MKCEGLLCVVLAGLLISIALGRASDDNEKTAAMQLIQVSVERNS
jgi:hypothetical protein